MTISKDEIIKLAREAGFIGAPPFPDKYFSCDVRIIEKFAHLCRADLVAENERLKAKPKTERFGGTEELVIRLRNTPNWSREDFADWKAGTSFYDRAPFEAADRIEELKAELSALRSGGAEPVVTGWDNGLSQDYNKKLGQWFANQPGARQQLREIFTTQQPSAVPVVKDLIEVAMAYQTWVKAVPQDTSLPTMPGLDGDWADAALTTGQQWLKENT